MLGRGALPHTVAIFATFSNGAFQDCQQDVEVKSLTQGFEGQ